jgi:hypothetical protein
VTTDRCGRAPGDPATDRGVSEAFRRAVNREHEAITTHERAADMHEAIAARLEAAADHDPNTEIAARRHAEADVERARATAARTRAAAARRRLAEEGAS